MNRCKHCNAVSRTTHPFGVNSHARTTFAVKHDEDCPVRKKWEKSHRNFKV